MYTPNTSPKPQNSGLYSKKSMPKLQKKFAILQIDLKLSNAYKRVIEYIGLNKDIAKTARILFGVLMLLLSDQTPQERNNLPAQTVCLRTERRAACP